MRATKKTSVTAFAAVVSCLVVTVIPAFRAAAAGKESGKIVFEDFTEKSGISRAPLPKAGGTVNTEALKTGVAYSDSPFDVFCGDLDGDGHADIVSADHHPSLAQQTPGGIWLGKGNGTFGPNILERLSIEGKKRGIGGGCGGAVDANGVTANSRLLADFGVNSIRTK